MRYCEKKQQKTMRYCEKTQAYKKSDNSGRLCLEETLCILEHAANKLLNKRIDI